MKPTVESLQALCPDVPVAFLRAHVERLDERYFNRFSLERIARHVHTLAGLSSEHPINVVLESSQGQDLEITVLAFDYPSEFSLIAGVMAGLGFNIHSGGIHTYARVASEPLKHFVRRGRPAAFQRALQDPLRRRKIVDHFVGVLESDQPVEWWLDKLKHELVRVIAPLESRQPEALIQSKLHVNEMVARRLADLQVDTQPALYPMDIRVDNSIGPFTRLTVVSEDTPAFLYAFSNALSLRGLSIEHIRIDTLDNRIEDLIDFVDEQGRKITDAGILAQVQLSVLLTKQFTYFLTQAPDPYAALSRFEQLVGDILRLPQQGQWMELLSNPKILKDLARLLGASDFLWEDMIRQQYETLIPLLGPQMEQHRFAESPASLPERLQQAMCGAQTLEQQKQRLNAFKDQEIFLYDLDHILSPQMDFRQLGESLAFLAEQIVRTAVKVNYADMIRRFGRPRTVAGLEATYAIMGLGKFGGAALGYASDIELLFVYSDNGHTDGPEPIENRDFFERLILATSRFIQAKREGIFNIDLRLRPFGTDGPRAVSLESFCHYYGPQGPAHAIERLALVRMRAVAGDAPLGAQLERLRDEFIYSGPAPNIAGLRELRLKQFEDKTQGGRINAKFSPGALVDLEYDVQLLQVLYGKDHPELRTPWTYKALNGLQAAGVLQPEEHETLLAAYAFLRELINGLRMLRGSAQDLFLPPLDSDEYFHLARRLGYQQKEGLNPAQQLHMEFETRTAEVRAFVERHFGRDSLPVPHTGNVADLILSDQLPLETRKQILLDAGFKNPERAEVNLRRLAGDAGRREILARLIVLACDMLRRMPDPDMALNNWERLVEHMPDPRQHFEDLLSQPRRLDLLLSIFSTSQFLADALVRHPEFFPWATDPKNLQGVKTQDAHRQELSRLEAEIREPEEWLNALRRYRRREILRIGTRDICLHAPLPEITRDLSLLADALVAAALDRAQQERMAAAGGSDLAHSFCILAFGKLGGCELNYSSDIDLVGVVDDVVQPEGMHDFTLMMERVRSILMQYTAEGTVYRVDLRLRPFGLEGSLVSSVSGFLNYYRQNASLGEIQSLLKLRPIAGQLALGQKLLEALRPLLLSRRAPQSIVQAVDKMRNQAMQQPFQHSDKVLDVKSGLGGIRDVEFMVQGLQLIHLAQKPELQNGNTLSALAGLGQAGILSLDLVAQITDDYIFLRRVEHYLQILEDRQTHTLPKDEGEMTALAKRMLGPEFNADQFIEEFTSRLHRVRNVYRDYFLQKYL